MAAGPSRAPRIRTDDASATTQATPTMSVMATSTGEKCPLIGEGKCSKKSQIITMIASQKRKHGSPNHFTAGRRANRTTGQSGKVWTTWCRMVPLASPTPTTSAKIIVSAHHDQALRFLVPAVAAEVFTDSPLECKDVFGSLRITNLSCFLFIRWPHLQ